MNPMPSDDELRALHAQSLQALSPTTLARLRQARHAGVPGRRRAAGWWLASACTAVLALGMGLGVQWLPPAEDGVAAAPMVAAMDDDNGSSALDENPDLYLWLAGTDLAME